METRRIAAYFALAFVAYLLWNAWQQEHQRPLRAPVSQSSSSTIPDSTSGKSMGSETSDVPPSSAISHAAASSAAKPLPESHQGVPASRLITIKTDTLVLEIDRQGGNVVSAKLLNYPKSTKTPDAPMQILSNQADKFYIAQSGVLSKQGPDTQRGQAIFSTGQSHYQLADGKSTLVVNLTWKSPKGVTVIKSFHLTRGKYTIKVGYTIKNNSGAPWVGHQYAQIKRLQPEKVGFFHLHTYRGAAISTSEKPYRKITYSEMEKKNVSATSQGGWLAMQQRYFLSAWIPDKKEINHYYTRASDNNIFTIGTVGPEMRVAKGAKASTGMTLYVGPELTDHLAKLAPHLGLTIDYGFLWWLSSPIFILMSWIHRIVGNWGWSIVLVTVVIKIFFWKLSSSSYRSMAKMRKLAPRLQQLKERFGDDRQKMSQATMELYRKEKVNPIGGCLPMVIQMPFFFALYWVLIESVQLRQAPFIFWIHDLAVKDPYFILPLLMGVSMFIQQKLSPAPPDPTQAKVMMLMPILFTAFFATFPSGLVLYWLVNNVVSIFQQWFVMRSEELKLKKIKHKR